MEVILLERIERLGQIGDVVTVKPGFARNFLLPQKKALRATATNREHFDQQRVQIEAANVEARGEAENIAAKAGDLTVVLIRQASDSGQLYGSVTSRDIAVAVSEAGFIIQKNQVILDRAIKSLGLHPIRVALHPEVAITVTANVAKTEEEAESQLQRGGAITEAELAAEEDAAEAARHAAEVALALADDKGAVAEAAEGLVEEEVESQLVDEAEVKTQEGEADKADTPDKADEADKTG